MKIDKIKPDLISAMKKILQSDKHYVVNIFDSNIKDESIIEYLSENKDCLFLARDKSELTYLIGKHNINVNHTCVSYNADVLKILKEDKHKFSKVIIQGHYSEYTYKDILKYCNKHNIYSVYFSNFPPTHIFKKYKISYSDVSNKQMIKNFIRLLKMEKLKNGK